MEFWTAFTIGILGSLHCVGMCGPIALAVPAKGRTLWTTAANATVYHGSRVLGYASIGLLLGLLGQGLFLAGFQKNVALVLGASFVIVAILSLLGMGSRRLPVFGPLHDWVQHSMSRLLQRQRPASLVGLGFLNAFLPCGLVYMALAGAVTQTQVGHGALYMALFGLGTLPLMLAISMGGHLVNLRFRRYFRRVLPIFMAALGILLLFRGLNVELPANWQLWADTPIMCH